MKKETIKSIAVKAVALAVVTAILEIINIKLLDGNFWEQAGIFLICAGVAVIVIARAINERKKVIKNEKI